MTLDSHERALSSWREHPVRMGHRAEPAFAFQVLDVLCLRYDGGMIGDVTLIGPASDGPTDDLKIGEMLEVPVHTGRTRLVKVTQFPLVRLGTGREAWTRVSVSGVRISDIELGRWAQRAYT